MVETVSKDDLIQQLQSQLNTARSEIKNLRQQIINLRHTHKNDVDEIQVAIQNLKCEGNSEDIPAPRCSCEFPDFHSIGKIESWFVEKRGIPRQSAVGKSSNGVLTIDPSVINNPAYALDGLKHFSHIWIIYHFHKTDGKHVRAKVAPPRLNGARVGVFGTRAPHRPCPIGLSLVEICEIVDNKIYFSGVDMLDGTPVLDIKPYIPQYDDPTVIEQLPSREGDGGSSNTDPPPALPEPAPAPSRNDDACEGREAPDGEETDVRVAPWVTKPAVSKLRVEFNHKGLTQLQAVPQHDAIKATIISVLEEDPRSVYLRKKLGNQFYTFLIQDFHVSCKFQDTEGIVTVYQVQKGNEVCECGLPQWQCELHGQLQ